LFAVLCLVECLLAQAVIARSVFGPFLVIVTSGGCARFDRNPGQHERSRGQRPGPNGDPVVSSDHELILGAALHLLTGTTRRAASMPTVG